MTDPRSIAAHIRTCRNAACDFCEGIAEDRASDGGGRDDWQIGQSRYEAELDRRWE